MSEIRDSINWFFETGLALFLGQLVAQARDERDAKTEWEVVIEAQPRPDYVKTGDPGWEPFGCLSDGMFVAWRRRKPIKEEG